MSDAQSMVVESWARNYRPRKFSDIAGQATAVSTLRGRIKQGKVPSFLLIVGPSGCGKTTLARLYSRYLNCESGTACGKCPSCKHDPDNHPDINELNAAEARGIDDIRSLVATARFKPRYKVRTIILDEAHQLTPQAQQAFLKPLEDTPKSTMYVVCTTDPEKLPTAMLTRAVTTISVDMPKASDMEARLRAIAEAEGMKVKSELLTGIVQASGGHVRSAINLLETAQSLLADNPKADTQKVLIQLGAATAPEAAAAAARLVVAGYLGLRKAMVRTVFDIEDGVQTINLSLRYAEYALGVAAVGNHRNLWHTPDCRKFLEAFNSTLKDKGKKFSYERMAVLHQVLATLRNTLVSVSGTPRSTLMASLLNIPSDTE